jgi:putative OPT family oligopeptide transporter
LGKEDEAPTIKTAESADRVAPLHPALSIRGMVIGAVGSAVITASSLYVALKMGALPWPIVFAALISLFLLRLLGRTSLNEVNVTHTALSAGAMVAGGLAFTIPALCMLGLFGEISLFEMIVASLVGAVLGLIATWGIRAHFIDRERLPYPVGISVAQTLKVTDGSEKRKAGFLFGAMGFAAAYAFLRDNLAVIPAMVLTQVRIPGVSFGIYNSPMMFSIGFIVGPVVCMVWFVGALLGDFGIVVGGTAAGFWDMATAADIKASLGMGVMLGSGVGVVLSRLKPLLARRVAASSGGRAVEAEGAARAGDATGSRASVSALNDPKPLSRFYKGSAALISAAMMLAATLMLDIPLFPAILLILGTWIAVFMSSQTVGISGINPMEVFGIMVMIVLLLLFKDISLVALVLVACVVAVASGITGDVMNDFKAGAILGTNPRDQWIAQCVGGIVGAVVAAVMMFVLVAAYGADQFGPGQQFVSAQASVVASMVSGIPHIPAFGIGIVAGLALALAGLPVLTLGLGIYLPFYLSLTTFVGGATKLVFDAVRRVRTSQAGRGSQGRAVGGPGPARRDAGEVGLAGQVAGGPGPAGQGTGEPNTGEQDPAGQASGDQRGDGTVVAAGLLGGESLMGVLLALVVVVMTLFTG